MLITTNDNFSVQLHFVFSYMTQVDRCLKGFESTTEWADLIAALTKLNKVRTMDITVWIQ